MELINPTTERFDIGKAAILGVSPAWDGSGDLFASLVHYGTMEGDVDPTLNPGYSELTLPELSGPAAIKRFLTGHRPTFTLGIFPDPDKLKLFSPTGTGSVGALRRRPVKEHTLWIVAEELFLAPDPVTGNIGPVEVLYAAGAFTKAGDPLSARDQELVDMSMVIWRADFEQVAPKFHHEDGGKSLKEVTVTVQQDFSKPDGCQLYLMLDEDVDFDVDFLGS